PSLTAALGWLEDQDHCVDVWTDPREHVQANGMLFVTPHYWAYTLFGIERAGLASGFKHLGAHDWYQELAARVLPMQAADGSFLWRGQGPQDAIVDTCYVLLFLSRGRHPVMMNKLRFADFWTNRPRDIANLASFTSKELERPV